MMATQSNQNEDRILDCGHAPSAHGAHTTGTAHTADGREICCGCADDEQRAAMRTDDQVFAYLSGDGERITTWTGGELAKVTATVTRRVGFHRATRVYLDATDANGREWYGTSPGPGMYVRLHARKGTR